MKPTENLEKALKKDLNFTAGADLHDRMLDDVLNAHENSKRTAATQPNIRRQKMFDKSRAWKVAAVVAIVIGAGALATTVGLKVRKVYFRGREPDGTYIFSTEPEIVEREDGSTEARGSMVGVMMGGVMADPNRTIDVEQTIRDLEEVDLLRQQDDRELVKVIEMEVNGKLQPRTFGFKYVLSDGREIEMGEGDPDTQGHERSLTEAQEDEVTSLLRADEYEELDIKEKEVRGRVFVFKRQRCILSDGTEVIKSIGMPK